MIAKLAFYQDMVCPVCGRRTITIEKRTFACEALNCPVHSIGLCYNEVEDTAELDIHYGKTIKARIGSRVYYIKVTKGYSEEDIKRVALAKLNAGVVPDEIIL